MEIVTSNQQVDRAYQTQYHKTSKITDQTIIIIIHLIHKHNHPIIAKIIVLRDLSQENALEVYVIRTTHF